MRKGCLVVVSGPSGAGKGTICSAFLERASGIAYSVSATTRSPRRGEVDGRDYYFVDEESFKKMIDGDELLEWAEVYGNYYGTPLKKIQEKIAEGKDILLEIDTQGAMQVKKRFPNGVFVFILPPSLAELQRRIRGRGTEGERDIEKRLAASEGEIKMASDYRYVIVNDKLDDAVSSLSAIVEAEHCRASRNQDIINEIVNN
ncbi:MAG: guanylate kinase [Schwartzia sp.]|nr:guanylate kinase [Schwartzia sp. (in: firmicutes)]